MSKLSLLEQDLDRVEDKYDTAMQKLHTAETKLDEYERCVLYTWRVGGLLIVINRDYNTLTSSKQADEDAVIRFEEQLAEKNKKISTLEDENEKVRQLINNISLIN